MCHVEKKLKFDIQEVITFQIQCQEPMYYIIKLNNWWCDYKEFQTLHLRCAQI